MLPSQKAQANSIVFLVGCTLGISILVLLFAVLWSASPSQNTGEPSNVAPRAAYTDKQLEAYQSSLGRLVDAASITSTDIETFLFETRVPAPYRVAHLALARTWDDDAPAMQAFLVSHQQTIMELDI